MLSSTQTNGQFLPSLQPPSATLQTNTRPQYNNLKDNKMLDQAVRHAAHHHSSSLLNNTTQSKSDQHLSYTHNTKMMSEDEAERVTTIQKSSNHPTDKKKDKKTQARKYLVEGLSTSQHGNNGRRLYRSNTFNHQQCATFNQTRAQRSLNSRHHRSHDPSRNRDQLNFISGMGHFPHEDTSSKVKKAIENWNELVLELQSEQYRRLNSYDGQFSLDSNSSSEEDFPSPIHKDKSRKPLYAPHSLLPLPKHSQMGQSSSNAKSNPNPFSLSFAKYRPITPGLLFDLDKNKLSSRKKTQRWINQLETQSRSYNSCPAKTRQQQHDVEEETLPTSGDSNAHAAEGITVSPISVRPLHRTESYGSTRTRQSGSLSMNKKQHHGFL